MHDSHGLNIKSMSHLYLEARSLTLSHVRFFSDGRVRHALDSKENREDKWRRKFSSAIYTKGLIEEVVSPVVSVENSLTLDNTLDNSRGSWSSLEIEGPLTPPPPTAPLPPSPSPPFLSLSPPPNPSLPLIPPSPTDNPTPSTSHPSLALHPSTELTSKVLKRKIQRGVQERVNDFWKEKIGRYIMQGDYLALIMEEGDSVTWKSFMWDIPKGVLKFAINAGVNTLPSHDNLKRWGKRVSDRCPFCGNIGTLAHILSNCPTALTQGRYTWRHNSVLTSIIKLVQPFFKKEGMILYSDMPGYQAPHGGTVPPHVLVTALKPDIVIISEQSDEVIVFELTCPWDSNISRSHSYKSEKYSPLISDLSQRFVTSFYSIEVSARGQITKDNRSRLKSFLFKCCVPTREAPKALTRVSSKAALLSSFSIFAARGEPSWENPTPLTLQ